MKLTALLSVFQAPPATGAGDGARAERQAGSGLAAEGPVKRSRAEAARDLMAERLPDPPPLSETRDIVDISREGSFVMAAADYDPRRMSPNEATEMAGMLRANGAIGAADHALLLRGPKGDHFRTADPEAPRDMIADWQMRLDGDMTRADLRAIGGDTRALDILGRVAAIRERL
ncbi:hypothetical protein KAJ83_18085 [Marivibrio halodurans]|uniref:Uncharacterized protein n=1 Tax=Marivibrio halodurans TaxID=2039722 RepID=A0A8J7V5H5_9PROT|nr:hypothetical protein [Marivibrio halodurans]MBP5858934.1 hypothetical protein [Marivibrio halodurans]